MSDARARIVAELAGELLGRTVAHTLRVAIDGPDAAGKTTLADDLAARVEAARPTIRLSVDGFHNPASVRRRRGSLSPEGFYYDSYDHRAIVDAVLRPLGPGGDGRYLPSTFDYRTDSATLDATQRLATEQVATEQVATQQVATQQVATQQAPVGAVLLFDGIFLLRPELRASWDASIYLHVDPEIALARARVRDVELFGSVEAVEERYRRRYLPGQRLYRQEARPAERADIVLDMNDPLKPVVLRWAT